MIAGKFRLAISISLTGLQIFQSAVYAGFLYLPFTKSYSPSLYVYDSYTLDKGWPTYGPKTGSPDPHTGTDYRGDDYGTPVYAAADGVVVALRETENDRCDITYAEQLRYGNYVFIEHQVGNTKYRTEYWHLKQNGVVVNVNDRVSVGTLIAYVSNSGLTRGSDCQIRKDLPYGANYHLHFEVKKWDGKKWVVVNPYNEWTGWLWVGNPPLPATWYLIRKQGTATVYFIEKGKKRAIPDRDTFLALGFEWEDVHDLSAGAFNSIPTGSNIPSVGSSWVAAYFSNNSLTMPPKLVRAEAKIDMQWGSGAPSGLPKDDFSARFVRDVNFPVTGTYRFHIEKDDGGRLWVGGTKIFDKWCHTSACVGHFTVDYNINAGIHLVHFDYYERGGSATARLWWDTPDKTGPQVSVGFGVEAQGGGWFASNVPVTINASDPSGIAEIAYQAGPPRDPDGWTRVYNQNSVSLVISEEGIHELYFNAKDKNGNWGNPEGIAIIPIDFTPPTTNFSYGGPSYHGQDGKLFVSPETQFSLEADDTNPQDPSVGTSGVAQTNYQVDEDEGQTYESEFSLQKELGDGKHEIKYQSDDVAGNEEPQNIQEVYLDSTPPTSTDDSDGEWHNKDVLVLVTAEDPLVGPEQVASGVKAIYYTINSGAEEIKEGDQVLVVFENEGTHELSYYAVDNVENVEEEKHVTLIKIDKTPPEITGASTASPNENGWYNEDVIVHFKAEDQEHLSRLKSVPPDTIVSTEGYNQQVISTAEDNAGNTASTTVGGINIDKNPPSSQLNELDPYYNNDSLEANPIKVAYEASDGLSGLQRVRLYKRWEGDLEYPEWDYHYYDNLDGELQASGSFNVGSLNFDGELREGRWEFASRAVDFADNIEDLPGEANTSTIYDITPPRTTAHKPEPNKNGWYNTDVEVTLEVTDEHPSYPEIETSGVSQTTVAIFKDGELFTDGAYDEWDISLPFEEDGIYTVEFYSEDRVGNVEEPGVATVRLDKTEPISEITAFESGGCYYDPQEDLWFCRKENWPGIYGTAEDNLSSVVQIEVRVDKDGEEGEWLVAEGADEWSFVYDPEDGVYTAHSRATDRAGNQEPTFKVSFVYDATPPTTSANLSGLTGLNGWYVSPVELNFKALDETSGIKRIFVSINDNIHTILYEDNEGGEGTVLSKLPFEEDGVYAVRFWSEDLARNIEQEQEVTFKINTTPPTVPAGSIPSGAFTEGETLRVGLTAEEGVKIYYSLNGSEPILYSGLITIIDDATLSAYAVDEAGNRSASVEFNYVFNPAPQVLGAQIEDGGEEAEEGSDLSAGRAGVGGEGISTPVGEPNPKGLGGWEILFVVLAGGVSYLLLRRRFSSRK